jgi:hypothetical protein
MAALFGKVDRLPLSGIANSIFAQLSVCNHTSPFQKQRQSATQKTGQTHLKCPPDA